MTFAVRGAGPILLTSRILARVGAVFALTASILIAVPATSNALAVTVNFELAVSDAAESGNHDVVVTLDTGGATTTADIVVDIADNGGSADTPDDYTVGTTQVTFSFPITGTASSNVPIAVVNDNLLEGSQDFELELSVQANPDGAAAGPTTTHTVTIVDDPGVIVSESLLNVTEGATGVTYTVVLTSQPADTVTITPTVGGGLADVTPGFRNFTTTNWDVPKIFTVSVPDDDIATGDRNTTITHVATSSDGSYDGIAIDDVDVDIAEDDSAGIDVSTTSVEVTEGGSSVDYTVVLTSEPTANVVVNVSSTTGEASVAPPNVTFNTNNWGTPKTFTVTAVDDGAIDGQTSDTLPHAVTSSDNDYDGFSVPDVDVTVNDDDMAGVTVSKTSLSITEGGPGDTYTVVLDSQPTGTVTITPSDTNGEVTVSPPSLDFGSGDWDTPKVFTVVAPNNVLADGDRTDTVEHVATSVVDPNYDGAPVADVDVDIADDEPAAAASIDDVEMSETDGPADVIFTFTISIDPPAAGATNVRIRTADATVFPATVGSEYENITNRNIAIPAQATSVTVDVEGYADNLTENDERFLVELFNPGGGLTLADDSGRATFLDDDEDPSGTPDSYNVDEGGSLTTNVVTGVLANDDDGDDGQAALTAILVGAPNKHQGTFTLNSNGSFTYDHDGSSGNSDSFTYRASDGDNQSALITVSIDIDNVAPLVDAGPDPAPVAEGVPVNINATFFDPGLGDNHTATIDWGDGTVENCPADCTITFNDQTGNGTVVGSHAFGSNDVYTVTVTVDDGPDLGSDTVTVNVQNANLTVDAGPNQGVDEGDTVDVNASWIDADGKGAHTATIDWGDGTVQNCPAACTIVDNGDGTGTVTGSHEYEDDGSFTVIVAVMDPSGDMGSGGFTSNVANVAPSAGISGPDVADEGELVAIVGTRSDPGADTFTYDWEVMKDGEFFAAADTKNLSLNLSDDGEYVYTYVVTDDDGGVSDPVVHNVTVANVEPVAQVTDTNGDNLPNSSNGGEEGVLLRLRSKVNDPGDEEFTYDWKIRLFGQVVASSTTDRLNYRPTENGTYFVTLTVDDGDGGEDFDDVLIAIDNAVPTVDRIVFDATPAIGAEVDMDVYFSDPGTDDTHVVTVDWGVGSEDGSAGASPRSFSKTYNSSSTRSAEVCVEDDDNGESCETFFVNPGVSFRVHSDFDGDGFEDLPIGVPGEDVSAGAVSVLYGSSSGLSPAADDIWKQGTAGVAGVKESNDKFGGVLAWGDFDLDGFSDLAVSAVGENIGGQGDVGIVHVLYGSATGLTADRDTTFHQDTAGVLGVSQPGDGFGSALTTGDFNGDGFADLAIGVPFEDLAGVADAGRVAVLFGSPTGLVATNDESWDQDKPGVRGVNSTDDQLGFALTAGDFNLDGAWELVAGMPGKHVNGTHDAGAILVLGGSLLGLDETVDQKWDQSSGSMKNTPDPFDQFGSVLESGDFNGDGRPDLAIGIPREGFGVKDEAGAVAVMLSDSSGLTDAGNTFWNEGPGNIKGKRKAFDRFGFSLAAGDFNNDGRDDLSVGIPYQEVAGKSNAGLVHVFYGSSGGLTAAGDQVWSENTPNIAGKSNRADHFGWSLRAFDQDGDGDSDLAISIPDQNIAGVSNVGVVMVLKGRTGPITAAGEKRWHQDVTGVREVNGQNDRFGVAL
ncbi:MAG: hypothetical protein HKN91_15040 [Acidimicrobiia bacterium]|nr:hypothetical protein [Acidimicrobiia bacterium]